MNLKKLMLATAIACVVMANPIFAAEAAVKPAPTFLGVASDPSTGEVAAAYLTPDGEYVRGEASNEQKNALLTARNAPILAVAPEAISPSSIVSAVPTPQSVYFFTQGNNSGTLRDQNGRWWTVKTSLVPFPFGAMYPFAGTGALWEAPMPSAADPSNYLLSFSPLFYSYTFNVPNPGCVSGAELHVATSANAVVQFNGGIVAQIMASEKGPGIANIPVALGGSNNVFISGFGSYGYQPGGQPQVSIAVTGFCAQPPASAFSVLH